MNSEVVQRLVYSMIQFLKDQLDTSQSSLLSEEGAESVEVAVQCLETAYGISQGSSHLAGSKSLYEMFSETLMASSKPVAHSSQEVSPSDKLAAEQLKNEGNELMRDEKYDEAISCYSRALSKDPINAVYFCNRAAACNKLGKHQDAINDCKKALEIDPKYSKAFGRMGLAYSALDNAEEAMRCYQQALIFEPNNESYQNNLQIASEKLATQTGSAPTVTAAPNMMSGLGGPGGLNLGALSGMMGGGGAGGGMPDLQGLLNNPGLMNMATQIMSDPNMQNMVASFLNGSRGDSALPGEQQQQQQPQQQPQQQQQQQPPPQQQPNPTAPTTETDSAQAPGMDALLNAGRHFAEQMRSQNPELVEQLRSQMNSMGAEGEGQQPPQPPPPQP